VSDDPDLIDTLLSIYSTNLSHAHLNSALSQLDQYLARFRNRLKPNHALWIRQTVAVLRGLAKVCEKFLKEVKSLNWKGKGKAEMMDGNTLMSRIGGGSDQVNLMEMVAYLKESKLARKVSGFAENQAETAMKNGKLVMRTGVGVVADSLEPKGSRTVAAKHASIASFHLVESFLLSLVDAKEDGRILLSLEDNNTVTLRYMLLNPAERFKEVIDSARSVILAGLFPATPTDRITTLSCRHVIPKENLLTQVVSVGPRKIDFEFKFSTRDNDDIVSPTLDGSPGQDGANRSSSRSLERSCYPW
jgi:chromosome transmission fidelity protein 1